MGDRSVPSWWWSFSDCPSVTVKVSTDYSKYKKKGRDDVIAIDASDVISSYSNSKDCPLAFS